MDHYFQRVLLGAALWLGAAQHSKAQSLDPSFAVTDIYQAATVRTALRQPDGKYVVSGNFLKVNGTAASGLVRLNADGSLDQAFTTAAAVQTAPDGLRLLPSGRILLVGSGTLTVGGQPFRNLVQLNADGSVGPPLATGTGSNSLTKVVSVQPDGKILLGGIFTTFNGQTAGRFVRLQADGSVDEQFTANLGSGFAGEVTTMLVQPDGKIVVGGRFQNFNASGRRLLVRLNADGSLDDSFVPALGGPAYAYVAHLGLDPRTNNLLVEGLGLQNQSGSFQSLLRLTPGGSQDSQFNPGSGQVNCYSTDYNGNDQLIVDSEGRILFGSCFETYNGTPTRVNSSLVRLLPSGAIDSEFAPGPALLGTINKVLLQPDGSVLLAGSINNAFSANGISMVRLDSKGQPDPTFQSEMLTTGYVSQVLSQPDGKLLIVGRFTNINGQSASNVARFHSDGSRDAAFSTTGPDRTVNAVTLQPNGQILVGGEFKKVAGNPAALIARLQPDGSFDPSFKAGFVPNGIKNGVHAIAVQPNGNVLVGGSTLSFTGTFGLGFTPLAAHW